MNASETSLSGKEQAKLNKRINFYNKLERQISQLTEENIENTFFPIQYKKKMIFPEYSDLVLILNEYSEELKKLEEDKKGSTVSLPEVDEIHFLEQMSKKKFIKLYKEEVFENRDGTVRKGSTGSIDDYNYQSAFNFYLQVLNQEELQKQVDEEKTDPTTYKIPVKMKKLEKKKYIKTYRYPNRRKR